MRIVPEPNGPRADIAIITALKVERLAVVNRLQDVERVQDDVEPLTFYLGRLPIPGAAESYRVVVAQLIDMGNNDASIATTRIIQRWRPRAVLMVGIAGGVDGKVALGDVVASQFAYYYEPAKVLDDGIESRGRQFTCDSLLYARAQHYEEAEWRTDIQVSRPGAADTQALPSVHFGPIGCGEKVIAAADELAALVAQCPKMLAVAMEGAGVARAVLSDGTPPRYMEIRGISDLADSTKKDHWHQYAANAAAAFTIGFLRSRPMAPTAESEASRVGRTKSSTLVVIAESLRKITDDEVLGAMPAELRAQAEVLHLDFTDLVKNKILIDPDGAARRVAAADGLLLPALYRHEDAHLVFCGLASIPLVVLAGHIVTDRQPVRLFDYDPDAEAWSWPGSGDATPELARTGVPKRAIKLGGDAIIRMSVTYPVLKEQTDILRLNAPLQVDLSVPHPARGIVRTEEQTRAYGRVFRETLDKVRAWMPRCRRVHVFYAGPMALAFHIGQQISENIHLPVLAWNYSREYAWAIDLSAAVTGGPCVVRTAPGLEEPA